jgi:hypothetical protein
MSFLHFVNILTRLKVERKIIWIFFLFLLFRAFFTSHNLWFIWQLCSPLPPVLIWLRLTKVIRTEINNVGSDFQNWKKFHTSTHIFHQSWVRTFRGHVHKNISEIKKKLRDLNSGHDLGNPDLKLGQKKLGIHIKVLFSCPLIRSYMQRNAHT